jgi:hypothetical protein
MIWARLRRVVRFTIRAIAPDGIVADLTAKVGQQVGMGPALAINHASDGEVR